MGRYPLAPRHHVTEPHGAQSQVAVFPKGSREALVEAPGRNQDGTPIGHVGGNPRRTHESQSAPLAIGGTALWWCRDIEPGLGSRHLVRQVGEVSHQSLAPVARNLHIVVEESNPLGIGRAPARIPGGSRPAAMSLEDSERG